MNKIDADMSQSDGDKVRRPPGWDSHLRPCATLMAV